MHIPAEAHPIHVAVRGGCGAPGRTKSLPTNQSLHVLYIYIYIYIYDSNH